MGALTSIGSSPTGRCSGLDKVPWRDLTLLDKLGIQAWGFHDPSRGSTLFYFILFFDADATINRTFLLFIALLRILRGHGDMNRW